MLYNLPKDINFIVCIGGRGGRKTYEVSKFISVSATMRGKRCVILRDEKSTIRESILNEVWDRYDTANENGLLDLMFQKNEYELRDKRTGRILIYTKGFRASSNNKTTNLKGASDIDIAVIEEGEDVRNQEKFNIFIDSLRKEGNLIIFILNTPDINHFIIKKYFNLEQVDDGYYKIIPKKIKGFLAIITDYKDNPFLPNHIIHRYESYGDKNSNLYDPHYYKTAILGYASTGRRGQILSKVKPIKLSEYLKLPFKEYYGQDFGTASPAGLIGVKFDKNTCWARQMNYKPLPILDIAKLYSTLKFNQADKIVVDFADPEWRKLKNGFAAKDLPIEIIRDYPSILKGFYVVPCEKGDGSIRKGLSLMQSMNLFAVEESTDLWNEIYNYIWATDRNGVPIDEPVDDFNHLIDPWRYVVNELRGKKDLMGY